MRTKIIFFSIKRLWYVWTNQSRQACFERPEHDWRALYDHLQDQRGEYDARLYLAKVVRYSLQGNGLMLLTEHEKPMRAQHHGAFCQVVQTSAIYVSDKRLASCQLRLHSVSWSACNEPEVFGSLTVQWSYIPENWPSILMQTRTHSFDGVNISSNAIKVQTRIEESFAANEKKKVARISIIKESFHLAAMLKQVTRSIMNCTALTQDVWYGQACTTNNFSHS